MAKRWNRIETLLAVVVLGIGAVILGVAGLWIYMSATATPIHPDAQAAPSVAQGNASQKYRDAIERGRQIARAHLAERNLPGLSVAVGLDGDIVWAEGFGWAVLESHSKVDPHTRFRIGDLSNMLTSAAAGVLIEKRQLQLDDDIQKYVPEFPKKKWPVTLRQVMGHTAGLARDDGDEGPLFGQHCDRPVEAFPAFANRDLRFEPGTEYRYTNFGFIVVSAAIEAAANEPFIRVMQKQVFDPLRMDDTMADSTTETIDDRATSYFPKFASDPRYGPDPMRDVDYSCYAGASVFMSTPTDLTRFAMAINGGTFLQPATVQMLQTSQRTSGGQETGYGLGWDLDAVTLAGQQTQSIGHDGELLGGIAASLMTFRDRGLAVTVISNTSYADTATLALKIADTFATQKQ